MLKRTQTRPWKSHRQRAEAEAGVPRLECPPGAFPKPVTGTRMVLNTSAPTGCDWPLQPVHRPPSEALKEQGSSSESPPLTRERLGRYYL